MKNLKLFFFILLSASSLFAQNKIFNTANELLKQCEEMNAELYSPTKYSLGKEKLAEAKAKYLSLPNLEEIFPIIQEAETNLFEAKENSKLNAEFLFEVFLQWDNLHTKNLTGFAKDYFDRGEFHFKKVIELSEQNLSHEKMQDERKLALYYFSHVEVISENEKVLKQVLTFKQGCEENNSNLFLPLETKQVNEKFETAIKLALDNNKQEFIQKVISIEKEYEDIYYASLKANKENTQLFVAKNFAEKADADIFAKEDFQKALEKVKEVGSLYFVKDFENAKIIATQAINLFYEAESNSIYQKYIGSKNEQVFELAENGLNEINSLLIRRINIILSKADEKFSENKYSEEIKSLSNLASYEILRGKKIVELVSNSNSGLIDSLIYFEIFPFGNENKELDKKDSEVKKDSLRQIILTQEIEKPSLESNKISANYINNEVKFNLFLTAKAKFNDKEAEIFNEENQVRIRLTGLKLAAYEKRLSRNNREIINKLVSVIDSSDIIEKIIIEVYSDSWGGDEINKKLSQERANLVYSSLFARGIPKDKLVALGIGNENSIASNNTFEGRNKNRRVEVILQLKK